MAAPRTGSAAAPGVTPARWGDYEFIHELGRGGMGVVYEARQVGLDRKVAVKVMLGADAELRARFEREARALARIDSPHVVKVLHAGERDGDLYFAMEHIDGEDLARRLKRGWRPGHVVVVDLVRQAALGLAAAAARGLIHRDIKPANMMLAADGVLKLMDFGLVRTAGEGGSLTSTGTVMGTVNYFSPEQGLGQSCDERSDIYSLGVAFFELLTSRVPFTGETVASVIYQHVHAAPPPPRRIDPTIPEPVQSIVLRCLAKAPGDRYQDARALIDDLDRVRAGIAVRVPKRRRSDQVGALVVALVAGAVITAGLAWWSSRTPDLSSTVTPSSALGAPQDGTPPVVPSGDDDLAGAVLDAADATTAPAALDALIAAGTFRADLPAVAAALRRGVVPPDFAVLRAEAPGAPRLELARLAAIQYGSAPRTELARLALRAGDDGLRLDLLRGIARGDAAVPELRDEILHLLEHRPVHAADQLPQAEESLIVAAIGALARDLPPDQAERVARLANGTAYGYQALLQHAQRDGVAAVLDAMLAAGRFRWDHYGVEDAFERGAIPADFAITRFAACSAGQRPELLRLAERQWERQDNEAAHRFLWQTVYGDFDVELRNAAFSAQQRAKRARDMPHDQSGTLTLDEPTLRRFFDSPAAYWPRLARALRDPAFGRGDGLRDHFQDLLKSAPDELGALLAQDQAAGAEAIAAVGGVPAACPYLAFAAAGFLAPAGRDPRWREAVAAIVARWRVDGGHEQAADWLARNAGLEE